MFVPSVFVPSAYQRPAAAQHVFRSGILSQTPTRSAFLLFCAVTLLAGCASAPPPAPHAPPSPPAPSAASCAPAPVAPVCPVCPACPARIATAEPTPEPDEPAEAPPARTEPVRGRLEKSSWDALPDWQSDDPTDALGAFAQSCRAIGSRPEWRSVCGKAAALLADRASRADVLTFFRNEFQPFQVVSADDARAGTVTGYYEPLLRGSRTRTTTFRYPVYAPPQDLVTIDLGEIYPDLKNKRLRGRLVGNRLVPYFERREIDGPAAPLQGLEIAWVDNAIELFFMHIQGSGQIAFADGTRIRVGYADQNGHPFRSMAGQLIRRGELRAENASLQGIKEWAVRHPGKVQRYLNANPSYVFFRELPTDGSGPIGTLGVPLTAERSLAVDARVIPLGVPVFLATTFPGAPQPLNRFTVAQDTGGAIAGAVRIDYFWGFGDNAGTLAGRMKQSGRAWVLLPNDYTPATERAPNK